MMLIDPIEHYAYPTEWLEGFDNMEMEEVKRKIDSGLYILKKDGWLRRGITTSTTACLAMNSAIASLYENVDSVKVFTRVGITLSLPVSAENGFAIAKKFSGDHEFDVTDGLEIIAKVVRKKGIWFGDGIGVVNGKKAVSKSSMEQIERNFSYYSERYGFDEGILIEVPDGEVVARKTKNMEMGIEGGISILGTTGFVEPWCDELVKTKIEIAMRYDKIAITTGRIAWRYAKQWFPDYQPFVFGVFIDDILKAHPGQKVLVGFPGLLSLWAGDRGIEGIERKAMEMGVQEVHVIRR
jgi:cobalt-precorrin-5B (C1)-methyltransferase